MKIPHFNLPAKPEYSLLQRDLDLHNSDKVLLYK